MKQVDSPNQGENSNTFIPAVRKYPVPLFLALSILLLIAFIGGGLLLGKYLYSPKPPIVFEQLNPPTTPSPTITLDETTGWKSYQNASYHLELKYPQNYSLSENSETIIISSPLSKCSPKLTFNVEEYGEMHELQIFLKKRNGSLDKILEEEGSKKYGWEKTVFSGGRGYYFTAGAEMITPLERYLVESRPNEVLDIQIYIFGSDDLGRCIPKLDSVNAMKVEKQILSTFQFIEPQFNPSRAEEILKTFYSLLNEKKYEEALPYYGGDFSVLVGWNPVINPGDKISLLRNGCEENGLHCLRVKTVKKSLAISETESKFVVQLADADGSVFKIGPCCGATEKEMPPRSDFECIVRKVGNKYLVMDLPPYSP